MVTAQDDTIAGLQRAIAELRQQRDIDRTERDAALTREAALADVLDVINRSSGDPGPVFEAILEKAHSLCGADLGAMTTYDGAEVQTVVSRGYSASATALVRGPFPPSPAQQTLIAGERYRHIPDVQSCRVWTGPGLRWRHRGTDRSAHLSHGASAQGRYRARLSHRPPAGGAAILATGDRTAGEVRRPGGDRDGERAADHRAARGAGTADRDGRGACRSSTRRLAIWRQCSMRCWRSRCVCARQRLGCSMPMMAHHSAVATRGRSRRLAAFRASHPPVPGPDTPAGRAFETRRSSMSRSGGRAGIPGRHAGCAGR